MTVQKEILQAIRKADDAFDKLFSREIPFSAHLSKQHDPELPDMYDQRLCRERHTFGCRACGCGSIPKGKRK